MAEQGAKKQSILALDEALGFNLTRVAVLFRRELMRALADYDMTPEQWQVMATLWQGRPLTQTEIVRLTLKDKPSVSRMIARLERNGWVRKGTDPDDARITVIHPTERGRELRDEVPRRLYEHFAQFFEPFGAERSEQLLALLKTLRRILGDDEPTI